jgi:hypothetical protein
MSGKEENAEGKEDPPSFLDCIIENMENKDGRG